MYGAHPNWFASGLMIVKGCLRYMCLAGLSTPTRKENNSFIHSLIYSNNNYEVASCMHSTEHLPLWNLQSSGMGR